MSAPGSPTGTAPVHPHLAAMGLTPPVGVDVAYEELLAEVLSSITSSEPSIASGEA